MNAAEISTFRDDVLSVISRRIGTHQAINRKYLLDIMRSKHPDWGITDRKMRAAIEWLRNNHVAGAWICSSLDGRGYYMASDIMELKAYIQTEKNRGIHILAKIYLQDKRASGILNGQTMLVIDEIKKDFENYFQKESINV